MIENKPLVTIVLTTYNSEKYVAQTIESLIAQTYENLEILISDDESKDGTKAILMDFANRSPRIRLHFNEKNLGISRNYDQAVRMAKGDFVIGISHDDILPPHHVERMVAHFDAPDVGLVHCNAIQIDSQGKEQGFVASDEEKIKKTKNPMKWLCFNNFLQGCGLMFRRQAYLEIKDWGEEFFFNSEWLCYIGIAERYTFRYATDTHGYYRVHGTNITKFIKKERRQEFERYQQDCRRRAMALAELSPWDRLRVKFKVARRKLRLRLGGSGGI